MFDPNDYSVAYAAEVGVDEVQAKSTYSKHTNGWRLTVSTLIGAGGLDVTQRLRKAFDEVDVVPSPRKAQVVRDLSTALARGSPQVRGVI